MIYEATWQLKITILSLASSQTFKKKNHDN